jgi:transcriptional regulator with XRE-family HTH domain
VELADNDGNEIHLSLKELMRKKSKRDRVNFTTYQLAKALSMPHSMLIRLMHPDPAKRVENPRIDTLSKIIEFFKSDGFNVTVDDLLTGFKAKKAVNVQTQAIEAFVSEKIVSVYSFEAKKHEKIGLVNVRLTSNVKSIIALLADEDVKPMFKKGSIFIIDTEIKPENDTLVAVKIDGYSKVLIRKFYIEGRQKVLKSYDGTTTPIILMPTMRYSILGVVIQVNAKT